MAWLLVAAALSACDDQASKLTPDLRPFFDLSVGDQASADLTTTAPPDLILPDLALPDGAMPDGAMPDLAVPDLALPDLHLPDLALPDLYLPDLAVPDLVIVPDLILPDLSPDAPNCFDNTKNGTETDVDCGGGCAACAFGKSCLGPSDCATSLLCDGTSHCAQCIGAGDCTGVDDECQTRKCTAGQCGFTYFPALMALPSQMTGDCKERQCNGTGTLVVVNLDSDVFNDSNPCTDDACSLGMKSNLPSLPGTTCTGAGATKVCNGSGLCVECNGVNDCTGTDTECQKRTCISNACGFPFVGAGIATSSGTQTTGDCKIKQCDGSGNIVSADDDTDKPVDNNDCTDDVCSGGVKSNPASAPRAPCNQSGGKLCDGAGACVNCVSGLDCPGADTECHTRTCTTGTCGADDAPNGTVLPAQTAKDCKRAVCDGAGNIVNIDDDADIPVDGLDCTADLCTAGVPSNPATEGAACTQNGGAFCSATGACQTTDFMVLRVGVGGGTALSTGAAPVIVQRYTLAGAAVGAAIALPSTSTTSGAAALTMAGSSTSEGGLSRSGNGKYVVLAGYNATTGVAAVASTTSMATHRVVGRIDGSSPASVDTTTRLDSAFNTNNVRSATSVDGTRFWLAGSSSGIQLATLGLTGSTAVSAAPANSRFLHVFYNQLYGTSGSAPTVNVFSIGSGVPITSGNTPTSLPGMPTTAGPQPYSFVFFDRVSSPAGVDTLYVADDRVFTSTTGGLQKWTTSDGVTWTLVASYAGFPTPLGLRGLAGLITGTTTTLIGTTTEAGNNRVVVFVDNNAGAVTPTVVVSGAGTNLAFRGVALAPLP